MKKKFVLNAIEFDGKNPPRAEDKEAMDRLTASIESVGLLHDPIVRISPGNHVICVAGERRIRACRKLKKPPKEILCEVVPWDVDHETIRFIENEQRLGVHPLDQAEKIEMMAEKKIPIANIALQLGESESRVQHLLLANRLEPSIKKSYREGKLTWPLIRLLTQCKYQDREELAMRWEANDWEGPTTLMSARDDVKAQTFSMKAAPWDLEDGTMPHGACEGCPKRSGMTNPVLFTDLIDDHCLDKSCWEDKHREHGKQLKSKAMREGVDIKKGRPTFKYVDVTRPVKDLIPQTRSKQTIEQMVGSKVKCIYFEHSGRLQLCASRDGVMKALADAKMVPTKPAREGRLDPAFEHDMKERHRKALKKAKATQATIERIVKVVAAKDLSKEHAACRWLTKQLTDQVYDATLHRMVKHLEIHVPKPASLRDSVEALWKELDKNKTSEQCITYLMVMQLYTHWPHSNDPGLSKEVKELCQLLKIDVRALKSTAASHEKRAKPKRSSASTPAKRSPKRSKKGTTAKHK